MAISNKFAVLLATKGAREKRRIPLTEVQKETGIAWKTLQAWQNDQVTRFDAIVIEALCEYLNCEPGELIIKI